MARRSTSSRWSRPATGKQIAALKGKGSYDGRYYSMGRASRAIGGLAGSSSTTGRRSSSNPSSRAAGAPMNTSGLGPPSLLSRLIGEANDLDSLLQSTLGNGSGSPLGSSGSGPRDLLRQLLGVPDDLDSLVQVALGQSALEGSDPASLDDPVESVSFTLRSDDSDPSAPRVIVETKVVHDSAFEGNPSLKVRFVADSDPGGERASDHSRGPVGSRSTLGYRPAWTPVLVHTAEDLAEQMRAHWAAAGGELDEGADPRMSTFLAGMTGMEAALAVLNSSQSSASRLVLLQGLLDPEGPIHFRGLGLDATTVAEQIRMAHEGDEAALGWLEEIQLEQVLTSFAEVTGTSLAAEADFRLDRWRKQGNALIEAVTMKATDDEFDFSDIRYLLTAQARAHEQREATLAKIAEQRMSSPESPDAVIAAFDRLEKRIVESSPSSDYGQLEDYFYEETRAYLRARFRHSLPAQFAAALMPPSVDGHVHTVLSEEVEKLASEASTDLRDYTAELVPVPERATRLGFRSKPYSRSPQDNPRAHRLERIVQAVDRTKLDIETAGDDDLGTLIVAQEVLAYAGWIRNELRAAKQKQDLDRERSVAAQRTQERQKRADAARLRDEEARKTAGEVQGLEQFVENHAEALARTSGSIAIQQPLPDTAESSASARLEHARAREVAAGERLAAAEERERWASAEGEVAATPTVQEQFRSECVDAVTEQSDARVERQAAQDEQSAARTDLALIAKARTQFEALIRPVREENERRVQAETERQRQEMARRADESRRRSEEQREKQAAERARQERANQRQEESNQQQQNRAQAAKAAIAPELKRLLALPDSPPIWRRKAIATTRASLGQEILKLQTAIAAPLVPPRTRSTAWPNMLSRNERYLGAVKKLADYGAFVSLPAGADGLLRGTDASASLSKGQLVIVEIADMPYGKPIVLKLVYS